MEALALVLPLALIAISAMFVYRLSVFLISGWLDAPFVPTPERYADLISEVLELSPGDIVYELGSGDGAFMLACARLSPDCTFVGIERNPLLHVAALFSRKRAGTPANVEFRRGNFFDADLSRANKAYAYLLDPTMFRLAPKFDKEFRGRLVSRAFPIPRRELSNVVELTDQIGSHGQHLLFVYDF